jgi:hypothetical protein
MPSESEIVAEIIGKPWATVSKGELARRILANMQVIKGLAQELYCAAPKHRFFDNYPAEGIAEFEKYRRSRQVSLLKRALRIARLCK